jgi:hypothetical protein
MATAETFRHPLTRDLSPVIAVLEAHGLQRGYADYWESNAVTWNTDSRVQPRAVQQGAVCGGNDPGRICPYQLNAADNWYDPVRSGSSFLLVDPLGAVAAPPSTDFFGPPDAVYHVGRYAIYTYPYDIATPMRPDQAP